jgi:hypothetical protein
MAISHNLFDGVTYVLGQPVSDTDLSGEKILVVPTFPINSAKTNTESALEWGRRKWRIGGVVEPIVESYPNDPFSIRLIGLEFRGEGGRAYKVIDSRGRLFDLREDQLLATIVAGGIEKGGQLCGTFVWGTRGTQTVLVLVGSSLYNLMLATKEAKKTAPKRVTIEFEVGGIYLKEEVATHSTSIYNQVAVETGDTSARSENSGKSKVVCYLGVKEGPNLKTDGTVDTAKFHMFVEQQNYWFDKEQEEKEKGGFAKREYHIVRGYKASPKVLRKLRQMPPEQFEALKKKCDKEDPGHQDWTKLVAALPHPYGQRPWGYQHGERWDKAARDYLSSQYKWVE